VLRSVPGVCDVAHVRGSAAKAGAAPDLLLEIPHGATTTAHFTALLHDLRGPFPEGLRDFFHVNTDVGAPEVALRVAERVVAAEPRRCAVVVRCRIPRTFIDCNRVIDPDARPSASKAGQMTPGIANYVRDAEDLKLLLGRYAAYLALTEDAYREVCGAGGTALMVHSYAPKNVDVPVDERIVERLREAYEPANYAKWTMRAEVDLITNAPDGTLLAPAALVERVADGFRRAGLRVARNEAYSLHPTSMGAVHAARHPGRTLCIEIRRDLVVREFTPFAEMAIDPEKADRIAAVLASALAA
jgi:predicted N-formylglutamate amidohydrolase